MAQQVLVSMVDDLDGSEAHGTVQFGLDGKPLEIDLSAANAARLRNVLAPFIAAGCKVGRAGTRVTRHSQRPDSGRAERRPDRSAVRQWAKEHGHDVGALGRISAEVLAAYEARDQAPPVERGGRSKRGAAAGGRSPRR
jgi:Lsr2